MSRLGWRLGAAVLLIAAVFLGPFVYLLLAVGGDPPAVLDALTSRRLLRPLANSLALATATAGATAVIGTGLAVLIARTDLPWRQGWRLLLPLPLVIPSFVGATALLAATGPGALLPWLPALEGFAGSFAVLTLLCYPYVLLPVLARLSATPAALEEASRLLGRGRVRTAATVLLPQLRTAVLAGALLVFLYVLSDFGAVALLRYDTITRVMYGSRLLDRELSLTLGLVLGVLALLVAYAMRRSVRSAPPPMRGSPPHRYRLGRLRVPALLLVATPVMLGLVAPVLVFAVWVGRGSTVVGVGYSGLGDDLTFLLEPLAGSVLAAVTAAAATVLVILPVAFASVRRTGRLPGVAAAVVSSVFALPGLVVALALASWAVRAPAGLSVLYQSFALLVLGYLLHFGAQALGSAQAALAAVPNRLDEAAALLGAGPSRRFRDIDLPLVLPGLLAGGGLVLLSVLKELPATLLLAPTGYRTLATTIWNAAQDGFYAEVGIASLVLIALSALLTWPLLLRRAAGVAS